MISTDEPLPILPRELTDIPDVVRRAGPPMMPRVAEPYGVRLAEPDNGDAELISEWMNRPHLGEAWESDWPVQKGRGYLKAQLHGTFSRPYVTARRGADIGYVEVYRAAKDSIATRYVARSVRHRGARRDRRHQAGQPRHRAADVPKLMADIFEQDRSAGASCSTRNHRNNGARRLVEYVGCTLPRRAPDVQPQDGALRVSP
jgi:hypothetical protein